MQPLLYLSCPDDTRRLAIAEALQRDRLELTDSLDELVTIYIVDDPQGLLIRDHDHTLIQLSVPPPPDDVAGLARVALELAMLWDTARSFEDAESAGVIAANIAQEARDAFLPVLFAADALAHRCPTANELTNLLIRGCVRVLSILLRVTPAQRTGTFPPTCANTVIGSLADLMRAIASQAKVVTRLESPLPPAAIERADLERMLLNLVALAGDAQRIVVATSTRAVTEAREEAPAGDWVIVEVEHDGARVADEVRERAVAALPTPTPSAAALPMPTPSAVSGGLGLPSIARITRSVGGHIAIDNRRRGAKIEIWLPRAANDPMP